MSSILYTTQARVLRNITAHPIWRWIMNRFQYITRIRTFINHNVQMCVREIERNQKYFLITLSSTVGDSRIFSTRHRIPSCGTGLVRVNRLTGKISTHQVNYSYITVWVQYLVSRPPSASSAAVLRTRDHVYIILVAIYEYVKSLKIKQGLIFASVF